MDDEREDSPLPGVDDAVPDSPLPAASENDGNSEYESLEASDRAPETHQESAEDHTMQYEEPANDVRKRSTAEDASSSAEPSLGEDAAAEALEINQVTSLLHSGGDASTSLGKRTTEDADAGPSDAETAGKRSCHGDLSAQPAAYDGLALTAPGGIKMTLARKAPQRQVRSQTVCSFSCPGAPLGAAESLNSRGRMCDFLVSSSQ
jgi:hypothetical protein